MSASWCNHQQRPAICTGGIGRGGTQGSLQSECVQLVGGLIHKLRHGVEVAMVGK